MAGSAGFGCQHDLSSPLPLTVDKMLVDKRGHHRSQQSVALCLLRVVELQVAARNKPDLAIAPAASAHKSHLPFLLLSCAKRKSAYHMVRAIRHGFWVFPFLVAQPLRVTDRYVQLLPLCLLLVVCLYCSVLPVVFLVFRSCARICRSQQMGGTTSVPIGFYFSTGLASIFFSVQTSNRCTKILLQALHLFHMKISAGTYIHVLTCVGVKSYRFGVICFRCEPGVDFKYSSLCLCGYGLVLSCLYRAIPEVKGYWWGNLNSNYQPLFFFLLQDQA